MEEKKNKVLSLLAAKVILLFVLLLLSGFFSGSETALVGIGKIKARALVKRGVKGAEIIDEMARKPETMLTAVLIGNNIVNITASIIAASIAIELFGNYGEAIAIGVMTLLILTFAEIMPKTIAVHHAEGVSILVSKPMRIIAFVFRPFIKAFSLITSAFMWLLGIKLHRGQGMTEEEVESMLDIGEEDGAIEEDEREMMMGVLKLDEIVVKSVMKPKEEMVCLEVTQTVNSAVDLIKRSGYSRIPVFDETKDNIVGILYAKDLLIKTNEGVDSLKEIMKTPYFVPVTKRVDDLLEEFQRGRFHIAIVMDEERKTTGLVSLEDLLEVIVGSIYDEYDVTKMRGLSTRD